MFVGHLGAGLAAKAVEPHLNLGALFTAALFADLLLWALVLAGVESVGAPVEAGGARFFTFTFPWSHGLVATAVWSALAGALAWGLAGAHSTRGVRAAVVVTAVVASHAVLDVLVHVPDVPVAGPDSPSVGLGLWRTMPVALALEIGLALAALVAWLAFRRPSRGRAFAAISLVAAVAALTVIGPYAPGEPPPPATLALASLATLLAVVAAGCAIDRSLGMVARPPVGTPRAAPERL